MQAFPRCLSKWLNRSNQSHHLDLSKIKIRLYFAFCEGQLWLSHDWYLFRGAFRYQCGQWWLSATSGADNPVEFRTEALEARIFSRVTILCEQLFAEMEVDSGFWLARVPRARCRSNLAESLWAALVWTWHRNLASCRFETFCVTQGKVSGWYPDSRFEKVGIVFPVIFVWKTDTGIVIFRDKQTSNEWQGSQAHDNWNALDMAVASRGQGGQSPLKNSRIQNAYLNMRSFRYGVVWLLYRSNCRIPRHFRNFDLFFC